MALIESRSTWLATVLGVVLVAALTGADAPRFTHEVALPRDAAATSSGPPKGARLIFADDFREDGLDPAKWITCYPWANRDGCTNPATGELEWYTTGDVSVSGGALHLTARRQLVSEDGRQYHYTSGMVATAGAFQFEYGYVEFRAHLPRGAGLWPALWLLPSSEAWPPEIDVLEVQGGAPDVAALTYHPIRGQQKQREVNTADLAVGWHVFAIDWQPGSIVWYLDGRAEFAVIGGVPSQPMYLVMDLAVSGWPPPDQSTRFPASLDIDEVRVWQPG